MVGDWNHRDGDGIMPGSRQPSDPAATIVIGNWAEFCSNARSGKPSRPLIVAS